MTDDHFASVRRSEYPEADAGIFLDAASYGLLPRRTVDAVRDLTERRSRPGAFRDEEIVRTLGEARRMAARLVGGREEEISLAPNTSYGVNVAAACVAAGPRGGIVVSDGEFPANVFPWLALEDRGFTVERVPTDPLGRPDEERLKARLEGEDVRAFALSAVQFATGYRMDLRPYGERCRERGVLFCVDAIQALGAVPVDVVEDRVDILATGAQKWLCSPWGSGFVFVAERLRDRFDPPMPSWLAFEGATDFTRLLDYRYEFRPGGAKFELATLGLQDYLGMTRSIEVLLELDVHRIRQHLFAVQRPLLEWIRSRPGATLVTPEIPEKRAGIVAVRVPGWREVARTLRREGITCAPREGAIRFSPHFYNTLEEMEAVVERLDALVGAVG